MRHNKDMDEDALINVIKDVVGATPGSHLGIGDDAAAVFVKGPTLIAHDVAVEDVHFRWRTHSPADVGHSVFAANLSDIAAMGGHPTAAVIGLAAPAEILSSTFIRSLYTGMHELAFPLGCAIIGGDISTARTTMIGVTIIGHMDPPDLAPITRSTARLGDVIAITGTVGGSLAGRTLLEHPEYERSAYAHDLIRRHLRPMARSVEGPRFARQGAHAMLDVSDGVLRDTARMAQASGVGIEIELSAIPISPGTAEIAQACGSLPDLFAATGGDDYELLIAGPPALFHIPECAATPIGRVIAGPPGLRVVRDGQIVEITHLGWDHLNTN